MDVHGCSKISGWGDLGQEPGNFTFTSEYSASLLTPTTGPERFWIKVNCPGAQNSGATCLKWDLHSHMQRDQKEIALWYLKQRTSLVLPVWLLVPRLTSSNITVPSLSPTGCVSVRYIPLFWSFLFTDNVLLLEGWEFRSPQSTCLLASPAFKIITSLVYIIIYDSSC